MMLFKKAIRLRLFSSRITVASFSSVTWIQARADVSIQCPASLIKKALVEKRRHIMILFHSPCTSLFLKALLSIEKEGIKNWV